MIIKKYIEIPVGADIVTVAADAIGLVDKVSGTQLKLWHPDATTNYINVTAASGIDNETANAIQDALAAAAQTAWPIVTHRVALPAGLTLTAVVHA